MKISSIARIGHLVSWSILLSACGWNLTATTTLQVAGHASTAEIEGMPAIKAQPDSVTIGGPYGQVTIERERVRWGELAWTAIPADVPVSITIKRHEEMISAGPTTIRRTTSD